MSLSVHEILLAAWKRGLSFRKSDWELKDYPVVIRKQQLSDDPARSASYQARIVNWWLITGGGNTPPEAMVDLTAQFAQMKDSKQRDGKPMPRPGTDAPIEFASSSRVDAQDELRGDFLKRVLGLPWAFVSDQSTYRMSRLAISLLFLSGSRRIAHAEAQAFSLRSSRCYPRTLSHTESNVP